MNNDLDQPTPTIVDPAVPRVVADQPRPRRAAAHLNTTALLCTVATLAAAVAIGMSGIKIPIGEGD
jgi:hypothetical protein